jgi:DNA-binding XRE family transcriptional regulator
MNLQLMRLRKQAGYKNRDDFAERISVNRYTYRSWESGAAMMSLEQAYDVTEALGCTLDELVGRKPPSHGFSDPKQKELNARYENMNDDGHETLLKVARSMEKDAANRIEKDRQESLGNNASA